MESFFWTRIHLRKKLGVIPMEIGASHSFLYRGGCISGVSTSAGAIQSLILNLPPAGGHVLEVNGE